MCRTRSRTTEISLVVGSGRLSLTVTDFGVVIREGGRRSGLRNLSERAAKRGGEVALEAPRGGGTRLVWSVPLRHDA